MTLITVLKGDFKLLQVKTMQKKCHRELTFIKKNNEHTHFMGLEQF
jgi:hypothetical protein